MDMNRLKYFIAIAQTGSMRKTSELLRISPPALSKATKLLEEELGLKLFTHVGRNIVLTDQGKRLAHRGAELVREFELLRHEVETDKTAKKEVRIATFEVFSTYFLKFLEGGDWDDQPLVLHDMLPGELERAIRERQVDFGITYIPVPTPDIEYIKVCTVEMGVYIRKGAFEGMVQNELPFVVPVMPITGSPSRVRGLDGWPEDAYTRKIFHQVTLMESALELCRQGRGAGYFPRFVVQQHNERVREKFQLVRKLSPYPGRTCTTDAFIVKRKGDLETKTLRALAKAIRTVCRS
jgi:DNA-binding transcriptional LysR family regulator